MALHEVQQTCRTCGKRGPYLRIEFVKKHPWIQLPCEHWQRVPEPMEVVMWDPDGDFEVWGQFYRSGPEGAVGMGVSL